MPSHFATTFIKSVKTFIFNMLPNNKSNNTVCPENTMAIIQTKLRDVFNAYCMIPKS